VEAANFGDAQGIRPAARIETRASERVIAAPNWRVLAPVRLQTVCVRHEPPGLAGDTLDRHTLAWCERVNRSGKAYLTPALLDGKWMVRVSIGAEPTEREVVAALWELMREEAERG
jgi:aromatic-L-amino-acid decarboxylase